MIDLKKLAIDLAYSLNDTQKLKTKQDVFDLLYSYLERVQKESLANPMKKYSWESEGIEKYRYLSDAAVQEFERMYCGEDDIGSLTRGHLLRLFDGAIKTAVEDALARE